MTPKYNELLHTDNLHQALVSHFSYLCDSPGYETMLHQVMAFAYKAELEDGSLKIHMQGGRILHASGPADPHKYAQWPKSFRRLVKHHAMLSFPENGWGLHLGDTGQFESEYLEDEESELLDYVESADEVLCPITDYSDWVLYHPQEKNPQQQPALCYFSHEGGDVEDALPMNPGSYFLQRMSKILGIAAKPPKLPETPVPRFDDWYEKLSPLWRETLVQSNENRDSGRDSKSIIRELVKSRELEITGAPIDDLGPLNIFHKLEFLELSDLPLDSLSSLPALKKLNYLNISQTGITTLMDAPALPKLETLVLEDSPLTNLQGLDNFPKLENLRVNHIESLHGLENRIRLREISFNLSRVSDLEPLRGLKSLTELSFFQTRVKDLSPLLDSCMNIHKLDCRGTEIKLGQLLDFRRRWFDYNGENILPYSGPNIVADYTGNDKEFALEMTRLGNMDKNEYEHLAIWVNERLRRSLDNERHENTGLMLAELLKRDYSLSNTAFDTELAVNAVEILIKNPDETLAKLVFQKIIPDQIEDQRLAYNLACHDAAHKNKASMLHHIKLALEFGQEADTFLEGDDFTYYRDDAEFVDVCNRIYTPNPHEDPQRWWKSLPESFKDDLWREGYEDATACLNMESFEGIAVHSLEPLRYLTKIKSIRVNINAFTRLNALHNLVNLESLEIEESPYNDKKIFDLSPLKSLKNLKILKLADQNIESLEPLRGLDSLEELDLADNPVLSLEPLKKARKMRRLMVSKCKVDDIQILLNMPDLERLMVRSDKLRDYSAIRGLNNLTYLWIGNHVTTMDDFESLEKLEYICVSGDVNIEDFQNSHPECDVNKR